MENYVSPKLEKEELEKTVDLVEAANVAPRPPSFWIDFGPLLIFIVSFQWLRRSNPDEAMLWAAGIFAVAAIIALAFSWFRHRHVSALLIFSTIIIVATAALALFSGNKIIFFMKPTVMNALFGLIAIGGVLVNRNAIRLLTGNAFTLPDKVWNVLAIRWGLFFFAMAILNEFIWRTQTENFWAWFKVFGFMPLTILFTLTQIPLINRHGGLAGLDKSSDS